jgi:hypothetical protein
LRSTSHAAAAIDAAYGNHPRSISRLHDDELTCVLSFLALKDLAQLVRCSHRFNDVIRKKRSSELHIAPTVSSIAALVYSSLSHHVSSVRLNKRDPCDAHITRATLHQLRSLPQLTKLHVSVRSDDVAAALLQSASSATAETMQAALPTFLRSFSFTTRPIFEKMQSTFLGQLGVGFLAAAANMTQLTELRIDHEAAWSNMPLDVLVALPLLRKLTVVGSFSGTPLYRLRQLSQLRELELGRVRSEDFMSMCQPPHSLQLETLRIEIGLCEAERILRALLHLPMLTELEPHPFHPSAWPLLPQLPRLRRLTISPGVLFTGELASSLSESLAACAALDDLTLSFTFTQADGSKLSEDEQRTGWAALLHSVPNVRRLVVGTQFVTPFLTVLPVHLPRLEQLVLRSWDRDVILARLAHPTLQEFELETLHSLTDNEVHSLVHNPRLPQLSSAKVLLPRPTFAIIEL